MFFQMTRRYLSKVEYFCSVRCQYGRDKMVDPTEAEIASMAAAGALAGEYLEHLKKTDLAAFSESEWNTLIETVVTGYVEEMQRRTQDDPPF